MGSVIRVLASVIVFSFITWPGKIAVRSMHAWAPCFNALSGRRQAAAFKNTELIIRQAGSQDLHPGEGWLCVGKSASTSGPWQGLQEMQAAAASFLPTWEKNAIATTSTVSGKIAECVLGSSTVTACSGQNIGTGILGLVFSGLGSGTQILAFSGPLSSWGDSSSQFVCSSSLWFSALGSLQIHSTFSNKTVLSIADHEPVGIQRAVQSFDFLTLPLTIRCIPVPME